MMLASERESKNWSYIAGRIPGRNNSSCENRFNILREMLRNGIRIDSSKIQNTEVSANTINEKNSTSSGIVLTENGVTECKVNNISSEGSEIITSNSVSESKKDSVDGVESKVICFVVIDNS
jgi:hypothetical protein